MNRLAEAARRLSGGSERAQTAPEVGEDTGGRTLSQGDRELGCVTPHELLRRGEQTVAQTLQQVETQGEGEAAGTGAERQVLFAQTPNGGERELAALQKQQRQRETQGVQGVQAAAARAVARSTPRKMVADFRMQKETGGEREKVREFQEEILATQNTLLAFAVVQKKSPLL